MIELTELLQASIDANKETLNAFVEEAKEEGIKTEFNIGNFSVDTHAISTSQKIYMSSLLWGRLQGCKALGIEGLIEQTDNDLKDFVDSLDYQVTRNALLDAIKQDEGLLREAKDLLSNEDKRVLLLAKVKRESVDLPLKRL